MPVPEPRPGLDHRLLALAPRAQAPAPGGLRAKVLGPANWWAAASGALAASLACVIFWWVSSGPREPQVVLALNESREVSLVIDSERELNDATIRLYVSGSVALAGYEGEREIEWL